MRTRSFLLSLVALSLLQMPVLASSLTSIMTAQGTDMVVLVVGSNKREDCEFQIEQANNRSFTNITYDSGPIACNGGVVASIHTTRSDAERQISEHGGASELRSAASSSEIAEIVPLSGNEAQDVAAVAAKEAEVHASFEEQAGPDPEAARTAEPAAKTAGPCKNGRIGDVRRQRMTYSNPWGNTSIRSRIYYERVTCALWKIYKVEVKKESGDRQVRMDSHSYPWARWPGEGDRPFGPATYFWNCRVLPSSGDIESEPRGDWTFIPRHTLGESAYIKSDEGWLDDPNCRFNGGVHITGSARLGGAHK